MRTRRQKIKTIKELKEIIKRLKKKNKKIVLCTGVFDLVHLGHIDYFEKSRKFGDVIVVSVVNDKFVAKGPVRPIFNEKQRVNWLAALEVVDYVVLNGDHGPHEVMMKTKPNFFVKGRNNRLELKDPRSGISVDKKVMDMVGGKVRFVKELMHSTEIFNFIRKRLKRKSSKNQFRNSDARKALGLVLRKISAR